MAARKTNRKPARRKPKRRPARSRPRLRSISLGLPNLSELDQSRRDASGLALAGLGVLLAFVFYFGWDGGRVGHGLSEGLRFFFGAVATLTPLVLVGAAAALIMQREPDQPEHHRRLGVAILMSALMLGFAAGTLGLGPDLRGPRELFDPDQFMDRGGLIGETLYWAVSSLFSRAGAHLAFCFALIAGVLLTTGVSAASVLHRARALSADCAARSRDRFAREREWAREDAERSADWYTEPEGEPEVRALHEQESVSAPQPAFAAEDEALEAEEPDPLTRVEAEVEGTEVRAAAAPESAE